MKQLIHARLDRLGAAMSFACALHCAVMPIVIASTPVIGLEVLVSPKFENYSVVVCLALALSSLVWGFRLHRQLRPLFIFLVGASMLIVARIAWAGCACCCSQEVNWMQLGLAVSGGVALGTSHLINRKFCTCMCKCA